MSAILNGLPAPAQRMKISLRPGRPLSLSIRRCAPAVKSVVLVGRDSSCTSRACRSTSLKAFMPSRPNAYAGASLATETPGLSMAAALAMASWLLLRPVRKMYGVHLSPVMESATAGPARKIFLHPCPPGPMPRPPHRQRGADGNGGLVRGVGRRQQAAAQVGLALVVFFDQHQLFAMDHHAAARGVIQAQQQAGPGLHAQGLLRAGLAMDMGDADLAGLRKGSGG